MAEVYLAHRFLDDLQEIYMFSFSEWDERVADEYLNDIGETLDLLKGNPKLLKSRPEISKRFKLFLVNKHWMVCDVINDVIYVLTIKHVTLNLLERLKEYEPTLEEEARILYGKIKAK
ncbi:MAG: hypothetical protein BalsKO_01180 [Balneolaceae bacterium]